MRHRGTGAKRPHSIRFNSLWFMISALTMGISLVAVVVITLVVNRYSNTVINNSIEQSNTQIVENVSSSIDSYIQEMMTIADGLTVLLQENDVSSIGQESFALLRDDIETIAVFDNQGDVVFSTNDNMRDDVDITRQSFFTGVSIKDNQYMISEPHVQRLYENQYPWVITVTKGVSWYQDGMERTGIIMVDLNFSTIKDLCARDLKNDGYLYIANSAGEVIYHPSQQMLYARIQPKDIIFSTDVTEGTVILEGETGDLAVTVKEQENTDWKVVGVSRRDGLASYMEGPQNYIIAMVVGLMVLVLAISLLISRAIVTPIYNLMDSMENAWKREEITHAPEAGIYEVSMLGASYNKMVERIDQLLHQIKDEQAMLRKSEFRALNNQINPHFLYNTLESVVWLAEAGEQKSVILMISALSKHFRLSLSGGKEFITVEEELAQINNYLIIEKMRFGDSFSYTIHCDEAIKSAKTPKIMLQPLVENALVHGISSTCDDGFLEISAKAVGDQVVFAVTDNGCGIKESDLQTILIRNPKSKSGIGIKNVHQRVRLLYGSDYGVSVFSELDEGTTAQVRLPIIFDQQEESL